MSGNEKKIFVYDSFNSEIPVCMGKLFVNAIKGEEIYSFEYDDIWLKEYGLTTGLDPEIMPFRGRQYPTGKKVFGLFADASPDRWGRMLMKKKERLIAEREGRKPRKLFNSDFLLGVYDKTRMGGIRLKLDPEGPFLSDDDETAVPPWTSLRALEEAARQFENDDEPSEKWIEQLIRPGSSLGGARPKATVADTRGNLWIAKFPSKNDENDTGAWEMK